MDPRELLFPPGATRHDWVLDGMLALAMFLVTVLPYASYSAWNTTPRMLLMVTLSLMVLPLLYMVAFGTAMAGHSPLPGHSYLEFLIPGLVAMTCMTQSYGIATEINLHTPALLPNDYAPDVHERLSIYKRLANCDSLDDLSAMQEELVDRFGELPPQAVSLLESHRLRLMCKPLGIVKLDATGANVVVQFESNPPIEPIRIINLIQKNRNYKLAGQDKLSLTRNCPTLADRVAAVKELLRQLKP